MSTEREEEKASSQTQRHRQEKHKTHVPFARRLFFLLILLLITTAAILVVRGRLARHQRRHLGGEGVLVRELRCPPPARVADVRRAS